MAARDIAVDPVAADEPFGLLAEALWNKRDDAVAARFVLPSGLPDPSRPEAFAGFLESPEVREGLLCASQVLDPPQRAYIRGKARLYRPRDLVFGPVPPDAIRQDLIGLLDTRLGLDLAGGGAPLVAAVVGEVGAAPDPGLRFYRSTERWAFWAAGSAQHTTVILDGPRRRLSILVVGWDPAGSAGHVLETTEAVPFAGHVPADALPLAPDDRTPAGFDAFAASLRVSSPGLNTLAMRFETPALKGGVEAVAERIAREDLLPRLLAHDLVRDRAGPARPGARFRRGHLAGRLARLSLLMEEGGTFGGKRVEPPDDVAATIRHMAGEIGPGDDVIVYETNDRWTSWFVGLLLSTSVFVDTSTGTVTVLLLSEHD